MTALDPVYTIGAQIEETIVHHEGVSTGPRRRAPSAARSGADPSPANLGLSAQMSGACANACPALSCRPSILLADEPTTALDVTVQIQIILLLRRLQRELGMAVIFVTHDVGVSVEIADRLAVMYGGRFVESGPTEAVIRQPRHPYTEGLLGSTVTTERGRRLPAIPGAPPDMRALPPGCAFAPRCAYAEERCAAEVPPEYRVAADHTTRCVRVADGSLWAPAVRSGLVLRAANALSPRPLAGNLSRMALGIGRRSRSEGQGRAFRSGHARS
jgi:peptide/nickel transport system ATP-binding protein